MKIFTGVVINTKNAKTASIAVERIVIHPLYKKRLKRTRKYLVHDEIGVKEGDKVHFIATRPYSKLKRWKITEVLGKKEKIEKKTKKKVERKKK